jgi:hypothetical protein
MATALIIGGAIVLASFALFAMRRNNNESNKSTEAPRDAAKPSFQAKAWLKYDVDTFIQAEYASGIKVTLALYDRSPIVNLVFHNQTGDVHDLRFEQIIEVRQMFSPSNQQALVFDLTDSIQIGDGEKDQLVLMFGSEGASSVYDKLRDWMDSGTRFVFERPSGGEIVHQGRGGAMQA